MVYGAHSILCGTWMKSRAAARSNPRNTLHSNQVETWVGGFVTAYNSYVHPEGDIARSPDAEGMYAWLDNYCQRNPTTTFYVAVLALVEHLKSR
jgi:hypothetical protein